MAEVLDAVELDVHAPEAAPSDIEDLWSDAEPEEIVSVPKPCAYDPLTRL
ncbi:hypothetical protein Dvina_23940 [Dactylosporangium vinaceum]|uniref:Uncharacterized protein n=1 Tax=Dactylosporangium vinaceum TaxID=53362 RepID=A0ABV5MD57_9ACTN|nr:hypothetical protein [Dactylosporangium vinaceum]UAC00834.1 hypothetical protein Dvina_23940 [Dactylosporangium vinaceum]